MIEKGRRVHCLLTQINTNKRMVLSLYMDFFFFWKTRPNFENLNGYICSVEKTKKFKAKVSFKEQCASSLRGDTFHVT